MGGGSKELVFGAFRVHGGKVLSIGCGGGAKDGGRRGFIEVL